MGIPVEQGPPSAVQGTPVGASAAAGAPAGMGAGQLVALRGLVQQVELNGKLGTCVSFDPSNGRVTVDVEDGVGHVALKPSNLTVLR